MVAAPFGLGDNVVYRHIPKREHSEATVTNPLLPSVEGVLMGAVVG